MKKLTSVLCCLMMAAVAATAAERVKITVSNALGIARSQETVEVDAGAVAVRLGVADARGHVVVKDQDGRELASQVTYDGKLIFQVGVAAKGKSVYYAEAGQPAVYEPQVFGRHFPERMDDIAWENDRVAFRTYGPALQKNNEKAYGFDVWNKRTGRLIVEERYAGELDPQVSAVVQKLRAMGQGDVADDVYNAVSYHVDHGTGMDCYKVGSTLGCGTPALLTEAGDIVYPWCWKSFEILDQGPLRFTVKLIYNPETVDGQEVTEVRIVSLDAGSHLNRISVSYENLAKSSNVVAGIVVHNENPAAFVLNRQNGYMGYEDLGDPKQYKEKYRAKQNKDFGRIYVGAVFGGKLNDMRFQEGKNLPGAIGHILARTQISAGKSFTYYFGSGWSRNPETDIKSLNDWESYLSAFAQKVRKPLTVKM